MRHFPILLAAMALVGGCDKVRLPGRGDTFIQGHRLTDLVTAAAAPTFDPNSSKVTEVVRSNGAWNFHGEDGLVTVAPTAEAAYAAFKEVMQSNRAEGIQFRLLVSADAELRFKELRKLLREAAKSGFVRVDFLVRTPGSADEHQAFHLEFPIAVVSFAPPEIDPEFVRIAPDGAISVGAGASHVRLDAAESDASLPLLDEDLQSFAAAAKAAASSPVLQIHVDGEASYQRWIDVMACCHANGIDQVFIVDVTMETAATCGGMKIKPAKPGSRSLPVPPSRDRLRESFPAGANREK